MKKMSIALALVAMFAAATVASAGTINLFLSAGNTQAPTNSGTGVTVPADAFARGNAIIRIAPNDTGQFTVLPSTPGVNGIQHSLGFDHATVWLYADVSCRADGLGNEIISSLGLNIRDRDSGTGTPLTATGFTVFTSSTGAASGPWSPPSPNTPTLNAAGGLIVQNSRAVAVPASTSDALWHGYAPNISSTSGCGAGGLYTLPASYQGSYRVASLSVAAGLQASCTPGPGGGTCATGDVCAQGLQPVSNHHLLMQVGTLKITRVYEPTATNGGAPENVSFGYNGANPDTTVSGSTVGAESPNDDATVVIQKKGDIGGFDQNFIWQAGCPDGKVTSEDAFYIYTRTHGVAQPPLTALETWLIDVGGYNAGFSWVAGAANPASPDAGGTDGSITDEDVFFIYQHMIDG